MKRLWQVIQADARQIPLPAQSVHCVVTSPPYWQLRKYKGADAAACLGNEPTVEEYLANLLAVFGEVWRVLRDDGVLWVNLGDTRSGHSEGSMSAKQLSNRGTEEYRPAQSSSLSLPGIPERFALAMQAACWVWRDTIVWHKQSPMPESVSGTRWERCRVKIKVGTHHSGGNRVAGSGVFITSVNESLASPAEWMDCPGCPKCRDNGGLILRRGSWRCTDAFEYIFMFIKGPGYWCDRESTKSVDTGANRRNVWNDLKVEHFKGSGHYATFPPSLPARCIQASTSEKGCCPNCGAQWARMVAHTNLAEIMVRPLGGGPELKWRQTEGLTSKQSGLSSSNSHNDSTPRVPETRTLGWRPTCNCPPHESIPSLVLDPFAGVATTMLAALRLGRRSLGVELSANYCAVARQRLEAEEAKLAVIAH